MTEILFARLDELVAGDLNLQLQINAITLTLADPTTVALAALNATPGLVTETAADVFTKRSLIGTAAEITVTNGSGAAGNPTISLPAALTFTGKTVTGGTFNVAAISLTTPLPATSGGTGFASYAVGDILFASTTSALSKLADIATGNALISGGVGVAPSYGKIGISTHVSGLGTGVATALAVNTGSAGAFVLFNGALGSPSSVGTLPAHTLGGTISGGGNQINNVQIGAVTPLAGTFTTIGGSDNLIITKPTGVLSEVLTATLSQVQISYTGAGGAAWFLKDTSAGADLKTFNVSVASGVMTFQSLTDVGAVKFPFMTFDSATNIVAHLGQVNITRNSNANNFFIVNTNTDAGASAFVTNTLATTNNGSYFLQAGSTAAGGQALWRWTGTGGTIFDNLNAAGNILFRTGATPTNTLYMTPAQNVVIGPNVFTPIAGSRLVVSNNTANAATNQTGETPIVQIVGADSASPVVNISSFGVGQSAILRFSQAGGTAASPTATTSGQTMVAFTAQGFFTSGVGSPAYASGAGFVASSTENWVSGANGTRVDIYAAPVGGTLAPAVQIAGGMGVGTGTDPGAGAIQATAAIKSQGATQGIGYATGAGGTVTQITSRTTGVTLNKVSGAITLLSQVNTAVSLATAQTFTVTNSAVAATDTISVNQKSGTDKYNIHVTNVAAGSFQITNYTTGGVTNEAPVFNFNVIKGVAA